MRVNKILPSELLNELSFTILARIEIAEDYEMKGNTVFAEHLTPNTVFPFVSWTNTLRLYKQKDYFLKGFQIFLKVDYSWN